jgi:hypothetical protein
MSTIAKLNPTVRQARTARRNFTRFLERQRNPFTETGRFCIGAWSHMIALRNDSGSTGARKHGIAARVKMQWDASQAQPQQPIDPVVPMGSAEHGTSYEP